MADCPRKKSSMTPCIVEDGEWARADDGLCVGCGVRVIITPVWPVAPPPESETPTTA
jgi:hypothetical protein